MADKHERWDRWIDSAEFITGMPVNDLVVHPDDYNGEKFYRGLPVVVLGYVKQMRDE